MFIDSVQFYCGVVVHCGDCGSSQSDITEPCSPLSSAGSLEDMAPTQSQPAWHWGSDEEGSISSSKRPKQGKITQYFKSKGKKKLELKEGRRKERELRILASPPPTPGSTPTPVSASESDTILHRSASALDDDLLLDDSTEEVPFINSPGDDVTPPTPPATSPESCSSDISSNKSEIESGSGSDIFFRSDLSAFKLDEERTIRFPPRASAWSGNLVSDILCKWTDCHANLPSTAALIEHLRDAHVNTQTMDYENYVCKWKDCKVFGRTSCSRNWLERHVLSHSGTKPFVCIMKGCSLRFSSQHLLTRHINSHCEQQGAKEKKNCDSSNKLIRRNGKKLRIRSQPFSARIYDFFDAGIMEGLQHNLIEMTERRTGGLFDEAPGDTVTVYSKVVGKRTDSYGREQILLRWFPKDVISDEWVEPSKVERTRQVRIPALSTQSKDCLYTYLFSNQRLRRSTGRKPKPCPAPASSLRPDST